jgi:tetratricopeptide (TPR) repeat protein
VSCTSTWACLAQAYTNEAGWGWAPVKEGIARATEAARHAIAIAPDLAEGHSILARLFGSYLHAWKEAEASSRRARELAPGSPDVLASAASLAISQGRVEEAIRLSREAVDLDPLSSMSHSNLAYALRAGDRLEEAETYYRKALELAPQRIAAHMMLSVVQQAQGRPDEALAEAEKEPAMWARLTALAIVHQAAGRAREADEALRQLEADFGKESGFQIAAAHALRGERDAMFEWLERAHRDGDGGLALIRVEPSFRAFHGDPKWAEFLKKMGF